MKTLFLFTGMMLFITYSAFPQYPRDQKITAAEYFYNNDPGEGNGFPVEVASLPDVTVNLSNLDVPVNTRIYIRFQSTNGTWSAPRCIKRMDYFPITGATIAFGEYFVNSDPGQGNGMPVTFTDGTVNLNGLLLQQGDVVYFRIRDSYNRWSPARGFEYQFKEMRRAEYRIRLASTGNYTTPVIVPTNPSADNTCPFSCSKSNITWNTGDSLFIRYQTKEGFYSKWENGIVADAGGNQTICQGLSATLTATGGQGYQWSDGQAGSTITVTPDVTTTYYVTASSGPWITSVDSVTVFVLPGPPVPTITPGGPTTFCQGNSVTLNSSTGEGYTFLWYRNGILINNAVGPSYIATQSGNYTVTVTQGCPSTSSAILVMVNPIPPTPVITQNGSVISSDADTGNQWYFNDSPLDNETGQTINASEPGTYYVVVTLNGCSSAHSNEIYYSSVRETFPGVTFNVYPNPSAGTFYLEGESTRPQEVTIRIVDCLGHTVYLSAGKKFQTPMEVTIDLHGLSEGIYQMIITLEQGSISRTIVIKY